MFKYQTLFIGTAQLYGDVTSVKYTKKETDLYDPYLNEIINFSSRDLSIRFLELLK